MNVLFFFPSSIHDLHLPGPQVSISAREETRMRFDLGRKHRRKKCINAWDPTCKGAAWQVRVSRPGHSLRARFPDAFLSLLGVTVECYVVEVQARGRHASVCSFLPRGWWGETGKRATGEPSSQVGLCPRDGARQAGLCPCPGGNSISGCSEPTEPTQPLPPPPGLLGEAEESQKCSFPSQLQFPHVWLRGCEPADGPGPQAQRGGPQERRGRPGGAQAQRAASRGIAGALARPGGTVPIMTQT